MSGWIPETGGALPAGVAKGDLAVFDGTNWVRLGVGADGTVVSADSAQTVGVKWAAGGGGSGALTLIDHQELTASATAITFSAIPSTFNHLLAVGSVRTDRADLNDGLLLRVGNSAVDAGTNYAYLRVLFGGSTINDFNHAASAVNLGGCTAANADANAFGAFEATIHRYTDTGDHRGVHGSTNLIASSTIRWVGTFTGRWKNTAAAIDVISFLPEIGPNFVAGSAITLYGMG